jgi:hypothetical protein
MDLSKTDGQSQKIIPSQYRFLFAKMIIQSYSDNNGNNYCENYDEYHKGFSFGLTGSGRLGTDKACGQENSTARFTKCSTTVEVYTLCQANITLNKLLDVYFRSHSSAVDFS